MDVMHLFTGKESYADAAYYSMVGGYLGGLAAGAAGVADYLDIPADSQTKKVANLHGAMNLGAMGLYSLNLLMRRGQRPPTGPLPVLLSLLGTAGLIVSAWYGGEMVYELGMRVKPLMEEGPQAPEAKLPGDRKIEEAFRKLEQR
jgi:uncharacterized membrane protein